MPSRRKSSTSILLSGTTGGHALNTQIQALFADLQILRGALNRLTVQHKEWGATIKAMRAAYTILQAKLESARLARSSLLKRPRRSAL